MSLEEQDQVKVELGLIRVQRLERILPRKKFRQETRQEEHQEIIALHTYFENRFFSTYRKAHEDTTKLQKVLESKVSRKFEGKLKYATLTETVITQIDETAQNIRRKLIVAKSELNEAATQIEYYLKKGGKRPRIEMMSAKTSKDYADIGKQIIEGNKTIEFWLITLRDNFCPIYSEQRKIVYPLIFLLQDHRHYTKGAIDQLKKLRNQKIYRLEKY